MQPKLIVTLDRYGEPDFQAKAGLIIASMTGNAHFPAPLPAPAPDLPQLIASFEAYRAAYHASITRDVVKIEQRNVARQVLTDQLRQLAAYLEFAAHGDVAALASTGFDLRRDTTRNGSTEPLPAPEGFRVQHGARSGSLDVRVSRLPGAASYEVQTTQGDPQVDANWQHSLTAATSSRITLSDLPPAQAYWVRVRGVGTGGAGNWTKPVNIIVV